MNCGAENLYVHFPHGITKNITLQNTRNEMGTALEIIIAKISFYLYYKQMDWPIQETFHLQNNRQSLQLRKLTTQSPI